MVLGFGGRFCDGMAWGGIGMGNQWSWIQSEVIKWPDDMESCFCGNECLFPFSSYEKEYTKVPTESNRVETLNVDEKNDILWGSWNR